MEVTLEPINIHRKINIPGYESGFRELLRHEGRAIHRYFEQTTGGFKTHRIWISQEAPAGRGAGGDMNIVVGVIEDMADNRIYSYVNWGTGPRIIRARVANLMVFMRNYSPATRPGSLQTGYKSRNLPWARRSQVFHSAQARRFDKVIQHIMQGSIEGEGRRAMAKLAKNTWI